MRVLDRIYRYAIISSRRLDLELLEASRCRPIAQHRRVGNATHQEIALEPPQRKPPCAQLRLQNFRPGYVGCLGSVQPFALSNVFGRPTGRPSLLIKFQCRPMGRHFARMTERERVQRKKRSLYGLKYLNQFLSMLELRGAVSLPPVFSPWIPHSAKPNAVTNSGSSMASLKMPPSS